MKKIIVSIIALLTFVTAQNAHAQISDDKPLDGIVIEGETGYRLPIPYPPIRQADIMWKKRVWREIDFRQKMNQVFYYPTESHNNWRSFINVVLDGLKESKYVAYDISNTDELLSPITYNQIIARESDTVHETLRRPYPPYEEYDTTTIRYFDPTRVMRIRLKEDWYFDKQRSQLIVRIIAICPVMMVEKDGQEFTKPLFWISYDQARESFAQSYVFNRHNSADRRTYDELFWKRMFDSYIVKEENVYDRSINQYASGVDALFESERVKNDIFEFEQHLWSY